MQKNEESNTAMDQEIQEIMERAEMDALVEQNEQVQEDEKSYTQSAADQEAEAVEQIEKDPVLPLSKEYLFDGKKIDRIDFSSLPDMTTMDLEYADRILAHLQHNPADKYRDTLWVKYIAVRATGYTPEFFNKLSMRDMLGIVGIIRTYFLLGWE